MFRIYREPRQCRSSRHTTLGAALGCRDIFQSAASARHSTQMPYADSRFPHRLDDRAMPRPRLLPLPPVPSAPAEILLVQQQALRFPPLATTSAADPPVPLDSRLAGRPLPHEAA